MKKLRRMKACSLRRQRFGWLEGDVEERVVGLAARVFFDLHHHGGHQVEGLFDLRKFFKDLHHAVVVFEGMHAGPGEAVLSCGQILVERLVHVPEEAQVDFRHAIATVLWRRHRT